MPSVLAAQCLDHWTSREVPYLHFKYVQECSGFSHHSNKKTKTPNFSFLRSALLSWLCSFSPLSSYTSWKCLMLFFYLLIFHSPHNCWKFGSTSEESVLFMITGVFLTGKHMGSYCLKHLWFCWFPPLWNWTFTRLPWHLVLCLD